MSVLSAEETERVELTIDEVERHTAAEIVVTTLLRSEPYSDVRLWATVAVASFAAAAAHVIHPSWEVTPLLFLQFGVGVVAWFVCGLPPVLRLLLPKHRSQAAAERAAELAFLEYGIFNTRERTGVLILLSELEHKAVILGDQGIHARLQDKGWNELVAILSQNIRNKKPGDGLCDVITRLGKTLADTVPADRSDNPNELENHVRTPDNRNTRRLKRQSKPATT